MICLDRINWKRARNVAGRCPPRISTLDNSTPFCPPGRDLKRSLVGCLFFATRGLFPPDPGRACLGCVVKPLANRSTSGRCARIPQPHPVSIHPDGASSWWPTVFDPLTGQMVTHAPGGEGVMLQLAFALVIGALLWFGLVPNHPSEANAPQ